MESAAGAAALEQCGGHQGERQHDLTGPRCAKCVRKPADRAAFVLVSGVRCGVCKAAPFRTGRVCVVGLIGELLPDVSAARQASCHDRGGVAFFAVALGRSGQKLAAAPATGSGRRHHDRAGRLASSSSSICGALRMIICTTWQYCITVETVISRLSLCPHSL